MKEIEAQGEESGIVRDAWGQKEKKIYRKKYREACRERRTGIMLTKLDRNRWWHWLRVFRHPSATHEPALNNMTNASLWVETANSSSSDHPAHGCTSSLWVFWVCFCLSAPVVIPHAPHAKLQHLWPSPVNPTHHQPSTTPHRPIAFGFATIKHTFSHTASLSLCCYSNLAACALTPSSLRGYRRTTDFPCVSASGYFLYSAMPSVSLKIVELILTVLVKSLTV